MVSSNNLALQPDCGIWRSEWPLRTRFGAQTTRPLGTGASLFASEVLSRMRQNNRQCGRTREGPQRERNRA